MAKTKNKKEFSDIKLVLEYDPLRRDMSLATSNQRKQSEATPEEKAVRIEERRTQGRTGCKAPRINVSFSQSIYDYVRIMSRVEGKTMCAFINDTLAEYKEEHLALYNAAKSWIDLVDAQTAARDAKIESYQLYIESQRAAANKAAEEPDQADTATDEQQPTKSE